MLPKYIEKLQQDLTKDHVDSEKHVDLLNELAFITRGYGILEERIYAEKAFHLASQIQYLPGIAQAQVHMAFNKIYFDGDFEGALQLIWSARQTSLKADFNEAFVHSLVLEGLISWNLGQYERAFNLVAQALDSQYQVNQALLLAWGNYVMGSFYLELKDYDDALSYHLTALQYFEQTNDHGARHNGFRLRCYLSCFGQIGLGHRHPPPSHRNGKEASHFQPRSKSFARIRGGV
jgi:tetratricopeptide (TPR) repeat protein